MPPIDVKMIQVMLLSAVAILGIYILIINSIAYVQQNSIADYHIGCFLYDQTHQKSNNFRQRLLKLKKNSQSNKRYDQQIRSSELIDPDLHKRSVQLAKGVQNFIQRLVITKGYQQSNMQFFAELSRARASYEQCANQIKSEFDTVECNSLWSEYNQCFSRYNNQKQELNKLYNNRKNVSRQIDSLLIYDPAKNSDINIEQQLARIKQKYNYQNKENDKRKQRATMELKRIQSKHQSSFIEYQESLRQVNRTKLDYEMCKRNLKQFRKCQDITKALEEYGYSESIESLEQRMNTKRENLIKMRQLLLQSKSARFTDNQQIKIMYDKREEQFKKLIKLRLDMSWDQMKQCGCKEQDKIRLQSEYQKAKIKSTQISRSLNELSLQIIRFEGLIKQADKYRQTLLNEYREDTESLANHDITIPDLNGKLRLLKIEMDNISNQISGFNRKLNSIEFQCNQYKDQLANRVFKTDQVTKCMVKKDFYEKLAGKAKLILHDDDFSMKDDKKYIVQILRNVKYPRELELLQIQNQVQTHQKTKEKHQTHQTMVEQEEIFISIAETVKKTQHEL